MAERLSLFVGLQAFFLISIKKAGFLGMGTIGIPGAPDELAAAWLAPELFSEIFCTPAKVTWAGVFYGAGLLPGVLV